VGFRALTHVLQGSCPPVEPGELIPETYTNTLGEEESVDFERLVQLGAAEKVTAKSKKAKADAEDPEAPVDEPEPEPPPE
jgi:hypothetical protein